MTNPAAPLHVTKSCAIAAQAQHSILVCWDDASVKAPGVVAHRLVHEPMQTGLRAAECLVAMCYESTSACFGLCNAGVALV